MVDSRWGRGNHLHDHSQGEPKFCKNMPLAAKSARSPSAVPVSYEAGKRGCGFITRL